MAAGSLTEAFSFVSKRKREVHEDDLIENDYDTNVMSDWKIRSAKRPNLTQLPIRSPSRPVIAITPAFGQYGMVPGTLTPDSIPESHSFANHDDQNDTSRPATAGRDFIESRSADQSSGMDMEMSSPKLFRPPPTPIRMGRARSNDLMSPMRSSSGMLLSPISGSFARDRVPTPTASSFPGGSPFESSFTSATARHLRPNYLQQSTTLSPMVDAESWTPQIHRPPSPEPDEDAAMAGTEDSVMSRSFTNLSMDTNDDMHKLNAIDSSPPSCNWLAEDSPTRGLGLNNSARSIMRTDGLRMSTMDNVQAIDYGYTSQQSQSQGNGRTAKLHMGFRADCEKCIARVPGHYSHIIWSEATVA